jgi:hypothetical protein
MADEAPIGVDRLFRDDAPEEFSLTRRKLVVGAVIFSGGMLPLLDGCARAPVSSAPALAPKFMEVSSLLIDHRLDADVGARMSVSMHRLNPGLDEDIGAIIDIAKKKKAKLVEDFFPDIPQGRLKDTALAIISAWYTGVVEHSPDAEVFAFETALMYQPTRDVMTIPTYAISRPNGWNAQVPPLRNMPTF